MPAKRGTGKRGRGSGPSHGRPGGRPPVKRTRQNPRPRSAGQRPKGGPLGVTGDIVEGKRAVAEALEAAVPVRRAFVAARSHSQDPAIARMLRELEEAGIEVEEVSRASLDAISYHGAHQGIALEVEPYGYADLHELVALSGTGDALILCLDHVVDEGNLGAIVRSAECAGASGVVIPNRRAAGVGPGAYKTSAGALAHLKVAQVPNMATALEDLKRAGFWAVCATEHAEETLWDADLSGRVCVVMGSERDGVSRLVREHCDDECRLPQMGAIESLNVAQAATVFCYEWLRQTVWAEPAADGLRGAAPEDLG